MAKLLMSTRALSSWMRLLTVSYLLPFSFSPLFPLQGDSHQTKKKKKTIDLCTSTNETRLELINRCPAHFNNFLGEIGIQTIPTDMSFGVATIDGVFEWSSRSIQSFIGTLALLFSPWLWRLIFDIVRFSLFAQDILTEESMATRTGRTGSQFASGYPHDSGDDVLSQAMERDLADLPPESIGDYLVRESYSRQFMKYFLIPMVAAPWCIDVDEFGRSFPAKPLIRFM